LPLTGIHKKQAKKATIATIINEPECSENDDTLSKNTNLKRAMEINDVKIQIINN
jgi:hypothetical protein